MRKIAVLLILALLAGCRSTTEQYSSHTVNAKLNKACRVVNNLTLTVKHVSDSRCPEGCDCIWAGEAKVFIELNENGKSTDTCMVLPSRPFIRFKHYKVELKEVNPYPICNYQFPDDITVQFTICSINKETL